MVVGSPSKCRHWLFGCLVGCNEDSIAEIVLERIPLVGGHALKGRRSASRALHNVGADVGRASRRKNTYTQVNVVWNIFNM